MSTSFIGYGFSVSSGQKACHYTSYIFEKIFFDNINEGLKEKYNISNKFTNVNVKNKKSKEEFGINNFESVYLSLNKLFIEQSKILWEGNKPFTIGGDHSEGFASIKSVLFTEVLKHIRDNKDQKILQGNTEILELIQLADKGLFSDASFVFDKLVETNKVNFINLENFINNYAVIWVDAHPDFNIPQISSSKNFHGMAHAAALKIDIKDLKGIITEKQIQEILVNNSIFGDIENIGSKYIKSDPKNSYCVCARDIDHEESLLLKKTGVNLFAMEKPDESKIISSPIRKKEGQQDFDKVLKNLVSDLESKGKKIILEFDIDAINGKQVFHTGTAVGDLNKNHPNYRPNRYNESPAGPSSVASYKAVENFANNKNILSIGLPEASVVHRDVKDFYKTYEGTQTIEVAMKLTASFLGGTKAIKEFGKHMAEKPNITFELKNLVRQAVENINEWEK